MTQARGVQFAFTQRIGGAFDSGGDVGPAGVAVLDGITSGRQRVELTQSQRFSGSIFPVVRFADVRVDCSHLDSAAGTGEMGQAWVG